MNPGSGSGSSIVRESRVAMLPTFVLGEKRITGLVCGGNPFSGFSHFSEELGWEMVRYYTMPRLQETLEECWRNGINTVQTRGDRLMMRMILEHREGGGMLQWIAQTASEFSDIRANIREIAEYEPIAIYHHGTHVDNCWHEGSIDEVADVVRVIKDHGLPAGIGSHIPEVIEYAEEKGWETDFYMACFYNLARQYKSAPAVDRQAYEHEAFPNSDRARMAAVLRSVRKPCLGFKILAASRNCGTPEDLCAAFRFAYESLKPTDGVVVGMFQKHKNQVAENAQIARELLGSEG